MATIALMRSLNQVTGRLAPGWTARRARHLFTHPRRTPTRHWERAVEAKATRVPLAVGWSTLRWAPAGVSRGRVICMHGWEGRATQFGPLAERLVDAGFEVIALDGPGHGESPEEQAHPVAFARALLDAEHELGPFDVAVGHSMGAGALGLALGWGLHAKRAVLLASPSSMRNVLGRFGAFIGLPEATRERFISEMERLVGFEAAALDVARVAGDLTQPVLLVHDPDDQEVPVTDGHAILATWPGARWLEVEGLGHRRVLRDPAVHAAVVAFCEQR